MQLTRREFITTASSALLVNSLPTAAPYAGKLCFFSKHVLDPDWQRLAQTVKRAGFTGIDLTVRPGGHVEPARAAEDLPKAVAAIRAESLEVPMITTGLTVAEDATAQPILAAAGKLGVSYFKPGYYKYAYVNIRREQEQAAQAFRGLVELGSQHKVQAGFHNHAGYIGGPIWDFAPFIETMDARWTGYYFDPRHTFAEGGAGAWKSALLHITPRIKMMAVKDFYWEKTAKGWGVKDCPLGEGMVDWKFVLKSLAQANFHGPISLHIEYEIAGKTNAEKDDNTLAAAVRDLAFLKARIAEAYV